MAKILIVDDSELVRLDLREAFEKGSHTVIEAKSGRAALSLLEAHKDLRLLVTDINMPEMSGLDLAEAFHAKEHFENVPIIAISTMAASDFKARGKAAGVRLWIIKPFDTRKVVDAANVLISSS